MAKIGSGTLRAQLKSIWLVSSAAGPEKTVMEEAAKAAGLRLSAWIRDRLLKAAANELD